MTSVLSCAFQANEEGILEEALAEFLEMADAEPLFFKSNF